MLILPVEFSINVPWLSKGLLQCPLAFCLFLAKAYHLVIIHMILSVSTKLQRCPCQNLAPAVHQSGVNGV